MLGNPAVNRALELLAPVLFVFLLVVLGAPVAAFFGSFFPGPAGRPDRGARLSRRSAGAGRHRFGPALKAGLRLAALVLGADVVLLPLDIGAAGPGRILSLIVNGWLLGWEYFELAALRHLTVARGRCACANPMAGRSGSAAS